MAVIPPRVRHALKRGRKATAHVSWTVVDQGVSALTNLLMSVMVARSASADGFGAFAVAFLVYGLVLGFSRTLIGQPLQISFASAADDEFRAAQRHAFGAALVVGTAAASITVVAGLAVGGQAGAALIALSVWFPGLILQDTCRMAFFCAGAPKRATVIDVVWGAFVLAGIPMAVAAGLADDVTVLIDTWGVGSAISALVGLALARSVARVRGSVRWMRERNELSRYLSLEYLLTMGISQAGILMVGFAGTQAGVGALRAGTVLLGPTNVVGTAAMVFSTTEVARRPSATARQRAQFAALISGALATGIGAYVGVLLILPDSVGEHLLGDTWTGARSVLLPMCVTAVAAALGAGCVGTLYGMGLARATFNINVLRAVVNTVLLTVGVWHWGALGAAWALAITELVLLPTWFIALRKALRQRDTASDELPAQSPDTRPTVLGAP